MPLAACIDRIKERRAVQPYPKLTQLLFNQRHQLSAEVATLPGAQKGFPGFAGTPFGLNRQAQSQPLAPVARGEARSHLIVLSGVLVASETLQNVP